MSSSEKCDDQGVATASSEAQIELECHVSKFYSSFSRLSLLELESGFTQLKKDRHITYLLNSLENLHSAFEKMDCSRGWFCYWILHALDLLGHNLSSSLAERVVIFLKRCSDPRVGGYGGSPLEIAHLAPTYAAINALVIIGSSSSFSSVDRSAVGAFLESLRVGDGTFIIHKGGESDVRSVYCAVVIARILNIRPDELFKGTADWLLLCQTYEGGFGGEPGHEAHGGYTFCAVATLYLLNSLHKCDLKALLRWTVNRQMRYEGGFQGRTNKLVDSCYSFWQSAVIAIVHSMIVKEHPGLDSWLFDSQKLQQYVLVCCQHVNGGVYDKPGEQAGRDAYHTCYSLSGLSVAQNQPCPGVKTVFGNESINTLGNIHPVFNLPVDRIATAMDYFYTLPPITNTSQ